MSENKTNINWYKTTLVNFQPIPYFTGYFI